MKYIPIKRLAALSTLCLVAVLSFASLTSAKEQDPESTKLRLEPYEFETNDGQTVEAEMGYLTVPENRLAKDSRNIELAFVRFASTSKTPGAPIIYLAGGPGGSGITTARYSRFPLFMALRKFGDVIAFDQRGTGLSGGQELRCRETYSFPLDQPSNPMVLSGLVQDQVRACAERLKAEGVDVEGYTTVQSAADLEDLRRALKVPKISLWGISYGSHLALAVLKDNSQHVERAILAGLEGLDQTFKLPADQQSLLEDISRLAAADPEVRPAMPNLLASLRRLFERLQKEPVVVSVMHPALGAEVPVTINAFDLQVSVAGLLRGPATFRFLPDLVARMEQGDFVPLALQAVMESTGTPGSMMSLAMDCASGASPQRIALIQRQAAKTLLADAINFPMPSLCDAVPVTSLDDSFRQPLKSSVPVLLISGTLDGRTPVHNGDDLLPGLSQAHHLVLEGAGHSDPLFLSSPRILEIMEQFLSGRNLETKRLVVDYPSLVKPRRLANVSNEVLQRFVGSYSQDGGDDFSIMQAGSTLIMMSGGRPKILRPQGNDSLFYELENRHLELQLDAQQQVTGVLLVDGDLGAETLATKTKN